MTESAGEFAVIELKNTTETWLDLSVTIGGRTHVIASLPPDGSTRQLTPTGASWSVSVGSADPEGEQDPPPPGAPKGGTSTFE